MKKITIIIALALISSMGYAQHKKDSVKKPAPFVKELHKDSAKYKTPVLERIDTMKNNMPVVNPKKKNIQPK